MELRQHQKDAIHQLRVSISKGNRKPILGACCSFGKTITALEILRSASQKGKKCIFFCDRVKLVNQAVEAFERAGIEIGVIQGWHEKRNPNAMIQIASVQTVARMHRKPEFDLAIVDECHTHYKTIQELMDRFSAVPFIGLSATPYSKGLGKAYDDLIVPVTTRQLMDKGYLCPVKYYGGKSVDMKGVKRKALSTGGTDYDPKAMAERIEDEKDVLTGDIIANWKKYALNRPTIAFSPSIKHSKYLVEMFNEVGIPAMHVDGYMQPEDREDIFQAHENGEFYILSCSMLLGTGYDAPHISCLIDCYKTSSKIQFVQRAGRIMRLHDSKDHAVYLDHSGNVYDHGFPEDIVPEVLDDGEKPYKEKDLIKKEKKESKPKDCPVCFGVMVGIRCACGYEIPIREQLKTTDEDLVEIKKLNQQTEKQDKEKFYSELARYAIDKGYKQGWASNKYKSKFGVYPNKIDKFVAPTVSDTTMGYIKHEIIKYRYSQKAKA